MLIAEDEKTIAFAMKIFFSAQGFQVDCAAEREEAEALISVNRYSVVIADLRLTPEGGEEGLEIIRISKERSISTKVILLTAYKTAAIESEARRRGADCVLSKPRPLAEINGIVGQLLSH